MRLIIDTDCGTDDLLAIAFLASHPNVEIEAITTVHGLASAPRGASNLVRVLTRLGKSHVPVYVGAENPLGDVRRFPSAWIDQTERLAGVRLPVARAEVQSKSATEFFRRTLAEAADVTILALGPLTNIAEALRTVEPHFHAQRIGIVIMGGAVDVPGNLSAAGEFSKSNEYAEWNFYIDPDAAQHVFLSAANIRLIPLDATNMVPIHLSLLDALRQKPQTEAAMFALEILDGVSNWIEEGHYFAWDPLAAVLVATPNYEHPTPLALRVETSGSNSGRLIKDSNASEIAVHMSADHMKFEREYSAILRNHASDPQDVEG